MKIYTKTGDDGITGLYEGERVSKAHPIIEALGSMDELTSQIGTVRAALQKGPIARELETIQKTLILVMGESASNTGGIWKTKQADIASLEKHIDLYQTRADQFTKFILPGDNPLSVKVDIARTAARRAERALAGCEGLEREIGQYINRLADYLYVLARYIDKVFEETIKHKKQQDGVSLDLEMANQIIEKVKGYAAYKGIQVVIAVVTKEGHPISVQAMDDAFIVSYELAIKKAFTAAALKMPTHELAKLTAKGAGFEGLEGMLDVKIITLGGGYPIKVNGMVIGAVGVSGGSAAEDIDFARYGADFSEGE
jgi:ATP:cob(I)alamin adenosyltransferase